MFAFTERDGLSSYNVQSICQDKNGYIWIGTQDGLNKFNGKDFTIYNKTTTPALSGNDIRFVSYDSLRKCIWVCSSNGGVDAVDPVSDSIVFRLTMDTLKKYLPDPSVQKIEILGNDVLCFNTPSGLLFYNLKAKRVITNVLQPFSTSSVQTRFVNGVFLSNKSFYTVTSGLGITVYEDKTLKLLREYRFDNDISGALIYSCSFDVFSRSIFICCNKGLFKFSIRDNKIEKITSLKDDFLVYNICRQQSGNVILATTKGIFKVSDSLTQPEPIRFTNEVGIDNWDINVNTVYIGKDGETWYGARKGLMLQLQHVSPFEKYSLDLVSNIKLNHLYYLKFIDNENVLACDLSSVSKINLKSGKISQHKPTGFYYYFFEDNLNRKFISKDNGLFFGTRFDDPGLINADKICPELAKLSKYKFNSHLILNDSVVVLCAEEDKGVFVWNTKSKKIYGLLEGANTFESKYCNGIAKISSSAFLIVTDSELALYDIHQKEIRKINIRNERNEDQRLFLDVSKVNNEYWIASYGSGIFILDSAFKQTGVISVPQGLSNNCVYKMIQDGKGYVWATTNYGLNRINELTHKVKNYFIKDGLHSNAFEEFSADIKDGLIVVGGPNGLTRIDPSKLYTYASPKLCLFENLVLDDGHKQKKVALIGISEVIIPNDIYKVDINTISINYDLTSNSNYFYKIKELNDSWFSLGSKNTVSLLGLNPGIYHLQVKVANDDGKESQPSELILKFLPRWHQTWWFYLLIALTVAGMLYALYRYRISQIKKQHEIRKNIATDLHDDLGSTLNSVKVFTNLAISGVKQEESLQQVKDNLTEATMSLRDMIWVLDDSLDTVDELITRLKQFAIPVAAASNIEAIIKADSDVNSRQLTKEEKRNLFLICKEAVNNSIKYSGGSRIEVDITASGKKIQIVVGDNGKGFNVEEVKKGYGLKNMQYRAGQVKYKAELVSSPGKGTQVIIKPA